DRRSFSCTRNNILRLVTTKSTGMMRIIVLGASGQIGSVIFNGLKRSHNVTGTSRKGSNGLVRFDPFKDDWSTLGKPDVLINCVGQIVATVNSTFYHIHVALTKQILLHRSVLGNPRIVQISALGASSIHEVEFLKTKGMADDLLLQHQDTAVIRPSIVCTHRTMIVKKMLMLSNLSRFLFGVVPVPKGFLDTRIQPIMPEDLVDLVQQVCVVQDVKTLDAVGEEALSFGEIIHILEKNTRRRIRAVEVPNSASDWVVKYILSRLFPGVINTQQYQLLFRDNVADVERCSQLLGRRPLSSREFFEREFHPSK